VGRRNEKRGWLFGVALQVGAWGKASRGQRLMPGLKVVAGGAVLICGCDEKLGGRGFGQRGKNENR